MGMNGPGYTYRDCTVCQCEGNHLGRLWRPEFEDSTKAQFTAIVGRSIKRVRATDEPRPGLMPAIAGRAETVQNLKTKAVLIHSKNRAHILGATMSSCSIKCSVISFAEGGAWIVAVRAAGETVQNRVTGAVLA